MNLRSKLAIALTVIAGVAAIAGSFLAFGNAALAAEGQK